MLRKVWRAEGSRCGIIGSMKTGFCLFEYKYFSRKGNKYHGPSGDKHLAAASNYQRNANKVESEEDVCSVNLPTDRHALRRAFTKHSKTVTRQNAHIAEHFTIWFDKSMSREHQREALGRFLMAVTFNAQTQASGQIHSNDLNNPHADIILIDKSVNDGQPVGHFSRNATFRRENNSPVKGKVIVWARQVWEDECNSVLEEYGYDFRISCKSKLKQELEEQREAEPEDAPTEALEPAEAPADQSPEAPEPVEPPPPEAPISEIEPEIEDDDPADFPAEDAELMALTRADNFAWARKQAQELRYLNTARKEQARLRSEYSYWRTEAEAAREKAVAAQSAMVTAAEQTNRASQTVKETHLFGFRKGLNFKLGPLHIRTSGVEKAMKAEADYQRAAYSEAQRAATYRDADYYANRASQKVMELEQKVAGIERHLNNHEAIYGIEQDFNGAEAYFKEELSKAVKDLTPNDVMDAYENGEVTLEETKDILHHMGHPELVNWIEAQQEVPLH